MESLLKQKNKKKKIIYIVIKPLWNANILVNSAFGYTVYVTDKRRILFGRWENEIIDDEWRRFCSKLQLRAFRFSLHDTKIKSRELGASKFRFQFEKLTVEQDK